MEEKLSFLRQIPLFASFCEESLLKIAKAISLQIVAKDEIVCREGEPGDSMFLIRSGMVAVSIQEQGREKIINQLQRGDFFGEMALLTGNPRNATVRAVLDATLYALPKERFDEVLKDDPLIAVHLSRVMSRRLKEFPTSASSKSTTNVYALLGSESRLGTSTFGLKLAQHLVCEASKRVLIVALDHSPEKYQKLVSLHPGHPPTDNLSYSLKKIHQGLMNRNWFEIEGQGNISIFFVSLNNDSEFENILNASLPYLFDVLREHFDLVIVDLPCELNAISQKAVELSDYALFLISNSAQGVKSARARLDFLKKIIGDDPIKIRIGTSHLIGDIGLHRLEIQCMLNLPEIPEVWMFKEADTTRRKAEHQIEKEKGSLVGARKLARELGHVRIGLALGAGAARGWAHIGVLKILEEEGIQIDMIAGTSMGALVGAIYAYTGSADKTISLTVDNFNSSKEFKRKLYDYTIPTKGMLKGNKFLQMLKGTISNADFLDLKIPLYVMAVDLFSGKEVIFERGAVSEAVRASISIPGVFNPVILDNKYLIDGGVVNPVPVDVLIRKGADYIISVMIEKSQDMEFYEGSSPGLLKILTRSFKVMSAKIAQTNAIKSNVTIFPQVSEFQWDDFHRGREMVGKGAEAAREFTEEIKKFVHSGNNHRKESLKDARV